MSIRIIPPEEVAEILSADSVSEDIKERVNEVIVRYLRIAEEKFSKELVIPDVTYDLKGRTAGIAMHHPGNHPEHVIRLNHELLVNPKYSDDMFAQTIPHEVAHIVVQQLFPRSAAHGGHWVWVMTMFGLEAKRCHNYDTKPARVHERVSYYCECEPPQNVHKITLRMRNEIVFNGKNYLCRRCRQRLTNEPRR